MMERVLQQAGEAMAKRMDFDAWWLQTGLSGLTRKHCNVCLRLYKKEGWLRRHYLKTEHWQGYWHWSSDGAGHDALRSLRRPTVRP